ncbi:MAG: hypothetical protein K0R17_2017, partial [Rariglobus sp.]|nr:hypothetical protein [Rariglobus sp.]
VEMPAHPFASRPVRRMALTACVTVLIAGFVFFHGMKNDLAPVLETASADVLTLAQMQTLFPGQLNAVIERDGNVQLDLAGGSSTAASEQPLVVQLERGGHRLRVLSYSGRSITLELKEGRLTFEALVTSGGDVVLSGEDFVWSSTRPGVLAGYRVNAQPLNTGL